MKKKDFKSFKGNFKRLKEIVSILYEEGLDFLARKLKLGPCTSFKCKLKCMFTRAVCSVHKARQIPFEKKLTRTLERLGPTFVKLGQVLSLRNDFLPDKVCRALKELQNHVKEFEFSEALRILEEDLGGPVEDTFQSIAEKPIAAASMAQVHEGILKDGRRVIVKIQRPGIEETVNADLKIILWLTRQIEKRMPPLRIYEPFKKAREFAAFTQKELDFRHEAEMGKKFRNILLDQKNFYAPEVYLNHTTRRVLMMEKIEGRSLFPIKTLKDDGYDPKELAVRLVESVMEQIFVHGVFHGDPHPGNIILMDKGKICFIDFGMYGEINPALQRKVLRLLSQIAQKQLEDASWSLIHLAEPMENADFEGYYEELMELFTIFVQASLEEMTLAKVVLEEMQKGAAFGFSFPSELTLMMRSILTIESVVLHLYPDAIFSKELEPIVKRTLFKRFDFAEGANRFKERLSNVLFLFETSPDLFYNITDYFLQLSDTKLRVKEKARAIKGNSPGSSKKIVYSVLAAGCMASGALIFTVGLLKDLSVIAAPLVLCGIGTFLFTLLAVKKK